MSAYEVTGRTDYLDALYAAVDELRKTVEREGGNLAGRRPNATRSGTLLSCLIRLLEFDRRFGRLDRREVTGWIVRTVEAFHKLVRPRDEGPARLSTRCAGNNRMMYHAFGYVASLGDAPDWAKKDFGALLGSPAYHTTHPDEERFEFIRPGCHNDIITVCSTIEEGTEMWLWSSAETMALHEKVFGEAGFPKPDDPMRAYYAEYQRACREDPESIVALAPEAPAPAEHGEFSPIPACVVGWAEAPPTIDGSADDACWKDATALTEFTLPWSKADAERDFSRKSRLDTTIKLACDRENLYVIMIAPDLKPPERRRRRDSGQYRDDGIEIFLDTNFNRTSYWKIAVNLEGEPSDAYYVEPFLAASGWNPKMMIGRRPGVIEIALPFKEFTSKWSVDDLVRPRGKWSANFYRMGDGSSWAGHNMSISSHTPQGFGVLTFEEPEGR